MKIILGFFLWCALFVLCWPVALLALLLTPVVWLVALPLRLLGRVVEAGFTLIRSMLLLPARLLGQKVH